MRKVLFLFIVLAAFVLINRPVIASEFETNYQVQYILSENQNVLKTKVIIVITITNLLADSYVKKFSLTFPKNFLITNLKAQDDLGPTDATVIEDNEKIRLNLEFKNPNVGRNSKNTFFLEFDQDKLFQVNGAVWEVILPTIADPGKTGYKVIVNLPANSNKKISIAKPKPDYISGRQIVWDNPTARTIYAVFGSTQYYQTVLTYHLKNAGFTPTVTEVAFPPDTLYQKTYVESIDPPPSQIYQDEDGNFMGKYRLLPGENKTVFYRGTIEVTTSPREEIKASIGDRFEMQKRYLLTQSKYWSLTSLDKISKLKDAEGIYRFVTDNLQYNYLKVGSKNKRLGAQEVLLNPSQAVCVEFSDLFIATAREKGIYAREMEGYGFANDSQLRPLSLITDVLHSWPEYFDPNRGLWIQVDPTWENTSGIDYFNSLDLNHIVFAIHGKLADYPRPAGMYKTEDSKDISIQAVLNQPQELSRLQTLPPVFADSINDKFLYHTTLTLVNRGNVYQWNIPIDIEANNLSVSITKTKVISLAPGQKKEIAFDYRAGVLNKKTKAKINIRINKKLISSNTIKIVPFSYAVSIKMSIMLFIFSLFGFVLFRRFRGSKTV